MTSEPRTWLPSGGILRHSHQRKRGSHQTKNEPGNNKGNPPNRKGTPPQTTRGPHQATRGIHQTTWGTSKPTKQNGDPTKPKNNRRPHQNKMGTPPKREPVRTVALPARPESRRWAASTRTSTWQPPGPSTRCWRRLRGPGRGCCLGRRGERKRSSGVGGSAFFLESDTPKWLQSSFWFPLK